MQRSARTRSVPLDGRIPISALAVTGALTLLAGCSAGPDLEPAPDAATTMGPERAVATDAGVRLEIHTEAWSGTPENLERILSPVLVTLTNDGDEPLRIRYEEFRLMTETGQNLPARSVLRIEGAVTRSVGSYAYPHSGFAVAPRYDPFFDHFDTFHGPFDHDPLFHDTHFLGRYHHPAARTVDLPTDDMVRRALPEGVLEPGGKITGYLFFEHIGDDARRARLHFDLVGAVSEGELGSLDVPLVADGGS